MTLPSSCSRWIAASLSPATGSTVSVAAAGAGAPSSNSTRKNPRAGSPGRSTGFTVIVTVSGASDTRSDSPCACTDFRRCASLVERRSQLEPQLGTDRAQQVVRRLSADELQVSAGARRQVDDLVFLVHDQRRRTVLFEELLVQIGIRQTVRSGCCSGAAGAVAAREAYRRAADLRRQRQDDPRRHAAALEEPRIFVRRDEEIASGAMDSDDPRNR